MKDKHVSAFEPLKCDNSGFTYIMSYCEAHIR